MPQVNGQVHRIYFDDGEDVDAGQLLYTIDARPFDAVLQQAKANSPKTRRRRGTPQHSSSGRRMSTQGICPRRLITTPPSSRKRQPRQRLRRTSGRRSRPAQCRILHHQFAHCRAVGCTWSIRATSSRSTKRRCWASSALIRSTRLHD